MMSKRRIPGTAQEAQGIVTRRVALGTILSFTLLFFAAPGCTGTGSPTVTTSDSGASQTGGGAGASQTGGGTGVSQDGEGTGGGEAGGFDGGMDGGAEETPAARVGLMVYEGFAATTQAALNGFSDSSSVGLEETWVVAKGIASVQARATTTGWDSAQANPNHTLPLQPSGSFNFVENNSTLLLQATRRMSTPVDLTAGPFYLSFLTSSGSNDFVGQAGLRSSSSGRELMFGQGWATGSGVHSAASASAEADPDCRGQRPSPDMGPWEVILWIAKVQKTGTTVATTLYAFNLNKLTSPLPWNEVGATPLWSQTLADVADDRFDELEVEIAAWKENYPSLGQVRLGGTWASVAAISVSLAERVWTGGGADDDWSTGGNWDGGASPTLGERVRFAGQARTTPIVDQLFSLTSLRFDPTAASFTFVGDGGLRLAEGITNESTNPQTLAVPVRFEGPQAIRASSGDVTITGKVSGGDGLTVAGDGTVTLAGPSPYPGNATVSGRLVLANPGDTTYSAVFSGSGAVTLANPGPQKLGTHLTVADGAKLGVTAYADATSVVTDSLTVGGASGATLEFSVVGTSKVILDAKATTLNGTTTIDITRCPHRADTSFPLFSGYTGGTLVLGAEPLGWHGTLVVTGTTVNYRVTSVDFVHPGVLSTREDLLRMKAKVKAGEEPWKSGNAALEGNVHSQLGYVAHPHPTPCRGGGCASGGYVQDYLTMAQDASAAYQTGLRYWISGDTAYADAAIRNMDGYANVVQYLTGDSNALLMMGAQGFQWAAAAELLRDYQPWIDSGGFARFKTFLLEKFYVDPRTQNGLHAFLQSHNNTCNSHYWLNWDLFALNAIIAIGIVTDRKDIYQEAVDYYKNGVGNGAASHALWFMHPGYLGQSQEMGRDSGHASADPILLGQLCEVAWNQGDDLYAYGDNALLAISEYTFKAMAGNPVPWVNYAGCDATSTGVATGSMYRPGADLIWNHYVNRKGLAAPYTMPWAIGGRAENGGGAYGNTSGGYDQIGFTTLTHALDPVAVSPPPSGLKADAREANKALLWWWGSAYASSYNVKRSTSLNGPFTQIGTVAGNVTPLFADSGLTAGQTYTYVVSAVVNGKETSDSAPVSVTANQRLTGTVIGSDGAFTYGQWKDQLFDNAPITFYDAAHPTGDWAGLDLGAPYVITKVAYYPRDNFAGRMVGGQFQGSNVADFSSGVVTLFTIGDQPPNGALTTQDVSNPGAFRYVRYLGPPNGSCNAAEIQFHGHP